MKLKEPKVIKYLLKSRMEIREVVAYDTEELERYETILKENPDKYLEVKEDDLKYYKREHGQLDREEITYDEALHIMLGTWNDNDMTRDMLSKPNNIHCNYSDIFVQTVDGRVCMAGLWNMLPNDIEYDENGNRV